MTAPVYAAPARIPPHNLDAERAILGALLLEGRDALSKVVPVLRPTDFYTGAHRATYEGIVRLHADGGPVDLITLAEELRRAGQLETAGGPAALALLIEQASVAAHLASYVEIVSDMGTLRELIQSSTATINRAYDAKGDARKLAADAFRSIGDIVTRTAGGGDAVLTLRRAADISAEPVEYVVDEFVPRATLTLLGGRDGRGKTLLALEMARAVLLGGPFLGTFAVMKGPVVALLLDDPTALTVERLEQLGIRDHPDLWVATGDSADLTDPLRLLEAAAAKAVEMGAAMLLIDALYLLLPPGKDSGNSASAMGPVMTALNGAAERSGAAVVMIAHDNKGGLDIAGSYVITAAAKSIVRVVLPTRDDDEDAGSAPDRVLSRDKWKFRSGFAPKEAWRVSVNGVGKWALHGTQKECRAKEVPALAQAFLENGGEGTAQEISKAVRRRYAAVLEALKDLVKRGVAETFTPADHAGTGRLPVVYRRRIADPEEKAGTKPEGTGNAGTKAGPAAEDRADKSGKVVDFRSGVRERKPRRGNGRAIRSARPGSAPQAGNETAPRKDAPAKGESSEREFISPISVSPRAREEERAATSIKEDAAVESKTW